MNNPYEARDRATEYAEDCAEWEAAAEARARESIARDAIASLQCAHRAVANARELGADWSDVQISIEDAIDVLRGALEPQTFRPIGRVSALVVERALAARASKEAAE